jgi:polyisoprenyl-phosphate glycosyltransferase
MADHKLISIVCPVFNEEGCIPLFYNRLQTVLSPLRDRYDFELIFTNNSSTDRTLPVIQELRQGDPSVQVLTLSRNFGYQASVTAGLRHACGQAIVVIDVDCEDPPELIPQFLAEWEQGFDVVYGKREKRPESLALQMARKLFYRLNRAIGDSDIILDMAEFSLLASHVRDAMLANRSTFPFLRTEVGYVGFRRTGIPYDRGRRIYGKSYYKFVGMARFAIGGILSSSTFLLRFAAYLGIVVLASTLLCALVTLYRIYARLIAVTMLLDIMYLIFFVDVICIYLARIYKDGVDRPVFIVDWKRSAVNGPPASSECATRRFWTTNKMSTELAASPDVQPCYTNER